MKPNKALGYILLATGLFMIFYSVFDVHQVFKGKVSPFQLFTFKAISIDLSKFVEGAPPNSNLTQELISSDLLNRPLDLLAHVILMGFIATAGYRIGSLGVMMVRTIKVKLKEERQSILTPKTS